MAGSDRLTEADQALLSLLKGRGLSYAELGEVLGVESSDVRRRARRAVYGLVEPPDGSRRGLPVLVDRCLGQAGSGGETGRARREPERSVARERWVAAVDRELDVVVGMGSPAAAGDAEAESRGVEPVDDAPSRDTPARSQPRRRIVSPATVSTQTWWLVGIVAVGALLRFVTLGVQSFDHDEAVTAARVLHADLGSTLDAVQVSERTPPLYYLLAWGWSHAFGVGEVGLRALSALLGTAVIPVVWLAAKELRPQRAPLIAAVFAAVNPLLVYYAQEARAYALLTLLAALATLFFIRALKRRDAISLAGWAVFSALAMATHYFAGFLVIFQAGWLLWSLGRTPGARVRVGVAVAGVAVVGAALLPLLADQNSRHAENVGTTSQSRELVTALTQFVLGERLGVSGLYTLTPVIGLVVLVGVALLLWRAVRSGRQLEFAVGLTAFLAVIVPAAIALAGADYFNDRNVIGALPALLVFLAASLTELRRPVGLGLAATATAAWLVVVVAANGVDGLQRPDWRTIADKLRPTTGTIAIATTRGGDDPLLYYLRDRDARRLDQRPIGVQHLAVARDRAGHLSVETRAAPPTAVTRSTLLQTINDPDATQTLVVQP